MCYPKPGPRCSNHLQVKMSNLSGKLFAVARNGDRANTLDADFDDLVEWGSTSQGVNEINRALRYMDDFAVLYPRPRRILRKALRQGAKLRQNQLKDYDQALIKIGENTLNSSPDDNQLATMVKQVSNTAGGRAFLMEKLSGSWFGTESEGEKTLRLFKEKGSRELRDCVMNMSMLDDSKDFMDKRSDDYKKQFQALNQEYVRLSKTYKGLLTTEETAQLEYWRKTVSIPEFKEKGLNEKFSCQ